MWICAYCETHNDDGGIYCECCGKEKKVAKPVYKPAPPKTAPARPKTAPTPTKPTPAADKAPSYTPRPAAEPAEKKAPAAPAYRTHRSGRRKKWIIAVAVIAALITVGILQMDRKYYNDSGVLECEAHHTFFGKLISADFYDSNGKLEKCNYYRDDGSVLYYTIYERDSSGKISRDVTYEADGSVWYIYDHRTKKTTWYD